MPFAPRRIPSPRRRSTTVLLFAIASACGGGQARPAAGAGHPPRGSAAAGGPGAGAGPARGLRRATSVAAMELAGQKVLVLPVQAASGVGEPRDAVTREILFALGERDGATEWIAPDRLRGALRRSPGYAADP